MTAALGEILSSVSPRPLFVYYCRPFPSSSSPNSSDSSLFADPSATEAASFAPRIDSTYLSIRLGPEPPLREVGLGSHLILSSLPLGVVQLAATSARPLQLLSSYSFTLLNSSLLVHLVALLWA